MKKPARRGAKGILEEVLRKVPLSGVAEIRVPSDVRKVLVANIENLRESALDVFSREVSRVLSRVDFQRLANDVLRNYTLKVEAKIELVPKGRAKGPRKGRT
jgi:hypothetical protein